MLRLNSQRQNLKPYEEPFIVPTVDNSIDNTLTICEIGSVGGTELARLFVLEIKLIVDFFVGLISGIIEFFLWVVSLISWWTFYYILGILFFYLLHIYWPFFIDVFILVLFPLLRAVVIITNILIFIAIVVARIIFQIWAFLVPFLGMLLFFVIDIFATVMDLVFKALGAINLEPILNAFMNILFIIVDIACQLLKVLIKVGIPALTELAKVAGTILELLISVVKILLPVIQWIFKLLYVVIEPILKLIAFFFGNFGSAFGALKYGRSLLFLEPSTSTSSIRYPKRQDYVEPYAEFLIATLNLNQHFETSTQPAFNNWTTHRNLLSLQFIPETRKKDANDQDDIKSSDDQDDFSHIMAHTIYKGAKNMDSRDVTDAQVTLEQINDFHHNKDPLIMKAILDEYNLEHAHLELPHEERLGSLNYGHEPDHPSVLHARFHEERKQIRANIVKPEEYERLTGRKLLENTVSSENDAHIEAYMTALERDHARKILDQAKVFKEKHVERMKVATIMTNALSSTVKKHAETTFHPANIAQQWNTALNQLGYKSIWDVHQQFMETHKDATGFFVYISSFTDHPVFRYFKEMDPRRDESPYFHDWITEQKQAMQSGRKLFELTPDDSRIAGSGSSKKAFSGMPLVSNQNCFDSVPRHPLCPPVIPPEFRPEIPVPELTDDTIKTLKEDTDKCSPWVSHMNCFFCLEGLYNALVSIAWIISAITPLNFALAGLTKAAPWTGFFLDWIFVVPKFRAPSLFNVLCFIFQLWYLLVFILLILLVYKLLPLLKLPYNAIREAWTIHARPPTPDKKVEELDNLYFSIMANPQPPDHPIDRVFLGANINHHHHHHHHHPTSRKQKSTEEMMYDEFIRRNKALWKNQRANHLIMERIQYLFSKLHQNHFDLSGEGEEDIDYHHAHDENLMLENNPHYQRMITMLNANDTVVNQDDEEDLD